MQASDILIGLKARSEEDNNHSPAAGLDIHWLLNFFSCHPSSSAACTDRNLRGGRSASLLQQEQNRGAVTDCQVLLLSGTSGRHHQSRPLVCRWYVPTSEQLPGFYYHTWTLVSWLCDFIINIKGQVKLAAGLFALIECTFLNAHDLQRGFSRFLLVWLCSLLACSCVGPSAQQKELLPFGLKSPG